MLDIVIPREEWDTVEQYLIYLSQLAAYVVFASEFIADKSVLEIGCGGGYGADYISKFALKTVSIDINKLVVYHSQAKYGDTVNFMMGDGTRLPFKAESFDLVVSFQVIEHIDLKRLLHYLSEIKRVLTKNGVFILSTPNRKLRLLPFQMPWNPEHTKEYSRKELRHLLGKVFEEVKVYGMCSSEEIVSIEKKRVKQNPFVIYLMSPTYRMLGYILPPAILFRMKRLVLENLFKSKNHNTLIPQETLSRRFSVHDYKVDPSCPKDSLDLVAICPKGARS
ncbi:class I SAM-dependent methyltransferase [Chloroflexota bacterium]